jgi:sugar phosphate isomerase/epimerase
MFTLSGFADEISEELEEQLDVLQDLDIDYLELRGVWGKNVLDLTDHEVQRVRDELERRGMGVSAIGSPIGKIGIDDPFEPHLQRFSRAVELAEFFDCRYIRMFSFFVPEGEADAHREPVMERLKAFLDVVEGHPVVLLHENERHIYGDVPRRCKDIFETCASPQLRMTFDPANFVMCGVRPFSEGYEPLKDYISYLHIKDGLMEEKQVVPAGEGDGQLRELLRALQEEGYEGFASLEPHLAMAGRYDGFSGPELFAVAAEALRELLEELED